MMWKGFARIVLVVGIVLVSSVPAFGEGEGLWGKCRSGFGWFKGLFVRASEEETLGPRAAAHYAPTRWGQRLSCTQPGIERQIRKADFLLYTDFRDSIRESDNPEHADGSRTERFGVPGPPPNP